MLHHRVARAFGLVTASLLATGCVTHSYVSELSGVDGIRGEPIEYQSTTSYALHALFFLPLAGDASTGTTIERFAAEASERGGTRMRITQTSRTTYWFVFPPISFFVHPVATTVEGDVEGTMLGAEQALDGAVEE